MMLWRDPLVLSFGQSLLALLFAVAAIGKLRAGEEFVGVVRNFRLLPGALTRPFALGLPWLEAAVAAGLLAAPALPPAARLAALAAAGLLLLFLLAIAVNLRRGRREIDCGCFRDGLRQPLSWWLVARNALLAGLALWLATGPAPARAAGAVDAAVGLLAAAVLLTLASALRLVHAAGRPRAALIAKGP
jgi:hypothetical protein